MELNNEFRVAVPAAKTWEVLTDVERVAPAFRAPTAVGRRRRFHRCGEGEGRPDHGVLQGRCVFPGEGRGRAAGRDQGQRQGDPGQRQRRRPRHRPAEGRGRRHQCRHHHRPHHLGQGRAVRPRRARRRVDEPDRPVRQEPGGRTARRLSRRRLRPPHRRRRRARGGRIRCGRLGRPAESRCRADGQALRACVAAVAAGVVLGFLLGPAQARTPRR